MAFDERGGCVAHEFHQEGVLGFGVASQSVTSHGWFSHEPHQSSSSLVLASQLTGP